MAAQTPIANSRFDAVTGSLREVVARFTSVADQDTWVTGLGVIAGINVTSGDATAKTVGATWSGGTVTFDVTSGPTLLLSVSVVGS